MLESGGAERRRRSTFWLCGGQATRQLIAVAPKDEGGENAQYQSRNSRRAEDQQVGQNRADHRCGQQTSADVLAAVDPQQRGAADFDDAGDKAEPLTALSKESS